jgi:O-antigen/teichoic acid export membrane protein
MGRIKLVAKIRFFQQIINVITTCLLLVFGAKLYTIGLSSLFVALLIVGYLIEKNARKLIHEIWVIKSDTKFNYWQNFFPYQWKIALSWIGGYLIFQLFNPVLFAFSGAKAAGQMGATLAVLNGIIALSLSWVSTKVAIWSRLISLKNIDDLNRSFKITLWQSSSINLLALIVFCLAIFYLGPQYPAIGERFMAPLLLALFSATFFINNIINCWATYLRCFKKEPFLIQSIIVGILSAISTYFLGKYFGLDGVIKGYFSLTLIISLPMSYFLYKYYKKKFISILG